MKPRFVRVDGVIVESLPDTRIAPQQFDNMSDIDMLLAVRELLKDKWTQGSNALNGRGLPTSPMDPLAKCFCLRGGCIRVLHPTPTVLATDLHVDTSYISRKINDALGFKSGALLVQWNDTQDRTEKDVLALINERLRVLRKGKRYELSQVG